VGERLVVRPLEGERIEAQSESGNPAVEVVDETHERTPTENACVLRPTVRQESLFRRLR
jgi:hypothetical protein